MGYEAAKRQIVIRDRQSARATATVSLQPVPSRPFVTTSTGAVQLRGKGSQVSSDDYAAEYHVAGCKYQLLWLFGRTDLSTNCRLN
jgi:hypothetical protein